MRKLYAIAIALLFVTTAAEAVTIYAPNGLTRPFGEPDDLIMFDSADPAGYTVVGSMNVPDIGFGGMAFDEFGNLWAYASFYKSTGGAAAGLYRVDPATGVATVQGALATRSLQDIAYNPVDHTMYGITTQNNVSRLYTIDLETGAVSAVGVLTGLEPTQHVMSFAIDSGGNFYVHDLHVDRIYVGRDLDLGLLYELPQDTNYSQGMAIDWSRDNRGYHAAIGYGEYPHYFSQLNTFAVDGSGYVLGPEFGPELPDGMPPVECGDLAIVPIPEPASLLLLAAGLLLRRR